MIRTFHMNLIVHESCVYKFILIRINFESLIQIELSDYLDLIEYDNYDISIVWITI